MVDPAETCCCGCSLKTGIKTLGWLSIIRGVLLVGSVAIIVSGNVEKVMPGTPHLIFVLMGVWRSIGALNELALGVSALVAAHRSDEAKANFAWSMAAFRLLLGIMALFATGDGSFMLAGFIMLVFEVYFAYIFWSFKEALRLRLPSAGVGFNEEPLVADGHYQH